MTKNKIKIQLSEEDMSFLCRKLFAQLKAVVKETGEDIIKQSLLYDYRFQKDPETSFWTTEIDSNEEFKVRYELVCHVGDIIKTISIRKKKAGQRKRFMLLEE